VLSIAATVSRITRETPVNLWGCSMLRCRASLPEANSISVLRRSVLRDRSWASDIPSYGNEITAEAATRLRSLEAGTSIKLVQERQLPSRPGVTLTWT
jgi:hypothetical protein